LLYIRYSRIATESCTEFFQLVARGMMTKISCISHKQSSKPMFHLLLRRGNTNTMSKGSVAKTLQSSPLLCCIPWNSLKARYHVLGFDHFTTYSVHLSIHKEPQFIWHGVPGGSQAFAASKDIIAADPSNQHVLHPIPTDQALALSKYQC
jgi:hypothetical protein